MASQIQQLQYEGYLAADPEMKYTPNGTAVTNFRIGSNYEYKNSAQEKVKETTWIRVACWGKLAEVINQWCEKGSHVIVMGRLRAGENGSPEVYQLKSGTGWGASYEVTAEKIRIISGKSPDGEPEESSSDDEIPFD